MAKVKPTKSTRGAKGPGSARSLRSAGLTDATPPADRIIRTLRRNHDKSMAFVAHLAGEVLGLSISQYYRIEKDPRNASVQQIEQIAKALGVQASDILVDVRIPDALQIARVNPALPVMEITELGSRGTKKEGTREHISPWVKTSTGAFGLIISGDANSPVFLDGEVVIIEPKAHVTAGANVVAEIDKTGEIVIGKYRPLPARDPQAPGFVITPHNRAFDEVTCAGRKPGTLLGKIVEKRVIYR